MPKYARRAEKDLANLPPALRNRAETLADRLDRDPALGKKLLGKLLGKLAGKRSVRLGRTHRMIYTVGDDGVTVLTVDARKDAYR
ncbi:MAG: type II toxin-antitoxin system RelE family toxin [Acidimicrobiales bacterium]